MLQLDTFLDDERKAVVVKTESPVYYTVICFDREEFQEQRDFLTHDLAKDFAEDWVNKW